MEQIKNQRAIKGKEILENVRFVCKNFPESEETVDGFGHTVFKVNKKPFTRIGGTIDNVSLSFKSDKEKQEILLLNDQFFKTPYIGHHGWVSVKLPV